MSDSHDEWRDFNGIEPLLLWGHPDWKGSGLLPPPPLKPHPRIDAVVRLIVGEIARGVAARQVA
jgi:hypothetical protein